MTAPWTVHVGDARDLSMIPTGSVHCCVTSPPYLGLRDYGVDGQIGLEATPEAFLEALRTVFREVHRVLRADGTLWLNMGDSYAGGGRGGRGTFMHERGDTSWRKQSCTNGWSAPPAGLKSKDLLMMPARLAMALQADGWWLRAEICWQKLRPMPESAVDRPTKAHEMIYLLAKRGRYFYDGYAIREPVSGGAKARGRGVSAKSAPVDSRIKANTSFHAATAERVESRNARDVWTFDANPLRGEEHFATFPEELPRRAILAGTSAHGVCAECGAPYERSVEKVRMLDGKPYAYVDPPPARNTSKAAPSSASGVSHARVTVAVRHLGWRPTCPHASAGPRPATVLDPFCGSGTTGIVALRLGRAFVGVELSSAYAAMARRRIGQDAPLFNRAAEVP